MSRNATFGSGWVNATGLPDEVLAEGSREVAAALQKWASNGRSTSAGLLDRAGYSTPAGWFAQLETARRAVASDDVVSGVLDVTEGLMFQGAKWESEDPDDADVFNQMSADLDLDGFLRCAYRELFTASQVVVASVWGSVEYTVRGRNPAPDPAMVKTTDPVTGLVSMRVPIDSATGRPKRAGKGVRRKKKYPLFAPRALTVLDSARVVPIGGSTIWGPRAHAWIGTASEGSLIDQMAAGGDIDATLAQLTLGRYRPSPEEAAQLVALGVDVKNLLLLNPDRVWIHRLPGEGYEPFPTLRLRSVFRLLDLKHQLMEADRTNLVGASNYLLLVKKGTKEDPAFPEEIANLRENFSVVARLPVIFSDHRLEIEIITPKQDYVLQAEKYDTIDRRLLGRCLGSLGLSTSNAQATANPVVSRMIARVLESRRHMLKRALEHHIARTVVEHPVNSNLFGGEPNLAFTPRTVQIDSDAQITQSVMALRAQKELSRESALEYFGFDQEIEAQRREHEEESGLDRTFGTQVPFSSPALNSGGTPPPQITGPMGGRPTGGGQPSKDATTPTVRNPTPRKA